MKLSQPNRLRRIVLLPLLWVIAFLNSACSEKIDLDLISDVPPQLVVEATITDRYENQMVKLSYSSHFFYNNPAPPVEKAHVRLSDGSNNWQLHDQGEGVYLSAEKCAMTSGQTYQLEIDVDGIVYTASSAMSRVADIDSLSFRAHPWIPGHSELLIYLQEPGDTRDFYMWKVYHNGKLLTDAVSKIPFADDEFVNGRYISFPFYIFQPEDGIPQPGDTIVAEMYSINEEYYQFLMAMSRNRGAVGDPFSGPPANIRGNLDNGALGFFLATSVTEQMLILP